jgi:hypothetical protein
MSATCFGRLPATPSQAIPEVAKLRIPKSSISKRSFSFLVNSWREHLRQHGRVTQGDRKLEEQIRSYTPKEPTVRHLIYMTPH